MCKHQKWMDLARYVAGWSTDQSRKTGAVIVNQDDLLVSLDCNSFPSGIADNDPTRHERPAKYMWTAHAERNAIENAAKLGVSTRGCTMYMPWYPCSECAKSMHGAGISTVYAVEPDWNDVKYAAEFAWTRDFFAEIGIKVIFVPGAAPERRR